MINDIDNLKNKDRLAIEEFYKRTTVILGESIHSMKLFGSKVRGTDDQDSDIDIFIVVKNYKTTIKDKIIDVAFDVNLAYGVYISPRVVSLELFKDSLFRSTPFVQYVEKEGIIL
jgi:predicted nucleotidyltransferase